jgi:hypothetical protein
LEALYFRFISVNSAITMITRTKTNPIINGETPLGCFVSDADTDVVVGGLVVAVDGEVVVCVVVCLVGTGSPLRAFCSNSSTYWYLSLALSVQALMSALYSCGFFR